MTTLSFREHVRAAAARFLRTAVVIDDEVSDMDEAVATLQAPDPRQTAAAPASGSLMPHRRAGSLDVKTVVDAFADRGLICGVLKPTHEGAPAKLNERFVVTAGRADLVVLDWILNGDDGAAALDLIERLVDADQSTAYGRLRLIAIYTAEADSAAIGDAIKSRLGDRVDGCSDVADDLWIKCGGLRVIVIAKEGTNVGAARSVAIPDLPDVLIDRFSELAYGIVPMFALQCLAVLRENAHHLLRRFHAGLDAPFLSHRALTDSADAEDFALSLMSLELRSLLEAAEVSRYVNVDVSSAWAGETLHESRYRLAQDVVLTQAEAVALFGSGTRPERISNSKFGRFKSVTRALSDSDEEADQADHEFARLSCLAREDPDHYRSTRPPTLTLGTLLRARRVDGSADGSEWAYYLCVQPACDAVRLKRPTKFALLPMEPVSGKKPFDIVALGPGATRLYLTPSIKVRDLELIEFAPDSDERVRAQQLEERFVFVDEGGVDFYWIGQLRDHQAIRVATTLSGVLGRPGVNEYEWLRRHGRQP